MSNPGLLKGHFVLNYSYIQTPFGTSPAAMAMQIRMVSLKD